WRRPGPSGVRPGGDATGDADGASGGRTGDGASGPGTAVAVRPWRSHRSSTRATTADCCAGPATCAAYSANSAAGASTTTVASTAGRASPAAPSPVPPPVTRDPGGPVSGPPADRSALSTSASADRASG